MPIVFWQIRFLFWNLPINFVIIGAHSYESDTSLVLWYYLIMPIIKHLSVVIAIGVNGLVEWISHQSHHLVTPHNLWRARNWWIWKRQKKACFFVSEKLRTFGGSSVPVAF